MNEPASATWGSRPGERALRCRPPSPSAAAAIPILLVATLALSPRPAGASPGGKPAYAEQLVAAAVEQRLHEDKVWHRLLHYRRRWLGGHESEADGRSFFLAESGKKDPRAELVATLRGFFGRAPEDPSIEHPLCRFPARYLWLDEKLGIDRGRLPRQECRRFQDFWRLLQPESVTLVFSSYYLNNPASAFGHTFLRINKRNKPATGADLLDYGIDYSAQVDTSNALLYAIKGLFGLFPGTFRRVPYYLKVREYNDYESRDIWEYDLALNDRQVAMVVAHLWELGSTHFNYYYMTENCSYHVLGALEAADPELDLLDHVGWPVLPADTVKALFANPGLVANVRYRPSPRSQFEHRVRALSDDEVAALGQLVADPDAEVSAHLSPEQEATVLDAALDLADSRFARELLKQGEERNLESAEYQQRLLERRAELLVATEPAPFAPPFRQMPHVGHGSKRVGLGPGYTTDMGYFQALSFRMALHDLADPPAGYPETAAIEFLPFRLRYLVEEKRPWVEDFSVVNILSLSPFTAYAKPLSWKARIGGTRIRDAGCPTCFAGVGELAGGLTLSALDAGLMAFGMIEGQVLGLAPIDGVGGLPLRVGAGPSGGLRLRFTDDLVLLTTARWIYLPFQAPDRTWNAEATLRWQYVKNFVVGLEAWQQPDAFAGQVTSFIYF